MTSASTADSRRNWLRLAGDMILLLAVAAVLGVAVNLVRPAATRLPWVGDWEHHIETKAFRAGIPVTFLAGARERSGNPAVVVLDARVPEQYAAGHLPGAYNLPVGEAEHGLVAFAHLLTMETSILVYCGGPDCGDALELAVKLRAIGFRDVTLYPGGYAEWTTYGGETRAGMTP